MPVVLDALRIGVAILSLLVLVVGAVAYVRRPTPRMLLVVLLFLAFAAQGALLLVEVFVAASDLAQELYYLFQLVEIGLVAAIILKR